jgi:Tol biopolymer transport system component
MPLSAGTRIGAYEILAAIGAGGMGEVYRARDTKLRRDVALKILPALFAADPERRARFTREAHILASLNHPNIAAIYGIEEMSGATALVMELVNGETLADRLARGPLVIADAVAVGRQLCEALDAAHEKGIVHRDLKPANIKITGECCVKVLDFGLAKALDLGATEAGEANEAGRTDRLSATESPTMTIASKFGVIVGTAAYMSPEQAKSKPVDKRTDIWAFGCVLFEMLTGQRAFPGQDFTDFIAAVITKEPDWTKLPLTTPPSIVELLKRCLRKDPRDRLRDIGDVRIELLDSALTTSPSAGAPTPVFASRRARIVAAAVFVAGVASAFIAGYALRGVDAPAGSIQFAIPLPSGHALVSGPLITRDGRRIAYVSSDGATAQRLYVKDPNEFEARAIVGTEGASEPFFSPDGRWIAFFATGHLFKVDLEGGAPVPLADAPAPLGGTWREDDTLVFTPTMNGGLFRMNASGGRAEPLILPDKKIEYAYTWPHFLPGGRELLFTTWGTAYTVSRLILPSLERTIIAPGSNRAEYAASGHVLLGTEGQLQAVPYAAAISGGRVSPATVIDHVQWSGDPGTGEFAYSVSLTGTLVYAPGDITQRSLVYVNHTGQATSAVPERHPYSRISLAPNGRKAAVVYDASIWILDLERGGSTPLAPEFHGGDRGFPVWTPDSSRVYFGSNHEGKWDIYVKSASATGSAEAVLIRDRDQVPLAVAPDGTLLFRESHPTTGSDFWALPSGGKPAPWLATGGEEWFARFSPNGHWVAYSSDESGRSEIYVQPFRGSRDRAQVSTDGGSDPEWSPKGNRVFYRRGNTVMAADVMTGEHLVIGKPRKLFDGGWELSGGWDFGLIGRPFAVMPDGERLLMVRYEPAAIPTRINLIVNWFDQLKHRVPAK